MAFISEATALARAAAQKAAFPKGKINEAQAIDMFVAMANSQVGYASGTATNSMYAKRENWPDHTWVGTQTRQPAYWCYQGLSWSMAMAFGRSATIAGIGNQGFAHPGWLATWLGMAWMKGRGMQVPLSSCRRGDIAFQRWGRTSNPADHVEAVTGRWNGWNYPATGFNTITSGGGDPSTGATVAQVWRPAGPTVAICRPDWKALVAVYNAGIDDVVEVIFELTKPLMQALEDCGFEGSTAGVRAFQKYVGITEDGVPGPVTQKELRREVSEVKEIVRATYTQVHHNKTRLENLKNQIEPIGVTVTYNNSRLKAQDEALQQIAEAITEVTTGGIDVQGLLGHRMTFGESTAAGKMFPNGLTVGGALAYGAFAVKDYEQNGHPNPIPPEMAPNGDEE